MALLSFGLLCFAATEKGVRKVTTGAGLPPGRTTGLEASEPKQKGI